MDGRRWWNLLGGWSHSPDGGSVLFSEFRWKRSLYRYCEGRMWSVEIFDEVVKIGDKSHRSMYIACVNVKLSRRLHHKVDWASLCWIVLAFGCLDEFDTPGCLHLHRGCCGRRTANEASANEVRNMTGMWPSSMQWWLKLDSFQLKFAQSSFRSSVCSCFSVDFLDFVAGL